jgi:hypothetical protein
MFFSKKMSSANNAGAWVSIFHFLTFSSVARNSIYYVDRCLLWFFQQCRDTFSRKRILAGRFYLLLRGQFDLSLSLIMNSEFTRGSKSPFSAPGVVCILPFPLIVVDRREFLYRYA